MLKMDISEPKPSPAIRLWYNTLLEFKDGKVTVIKSYSCPAKDSDVQKFTKPKKEKPKAKEVAAVQIECEEVY